MKEQTPTQKKNYIQHKKAEYILKMNTNIYIKHEKILIYIEHGKFYPTKEIYINPLDI